jgi:IclR family acetate operon transcriptional repressor
LEAMGDHHTLSSGHGARSGRVTAPAVRVSAMSAPAPKEVHRVQVLDRAAQILRVIATEPQPLNAVELARRCKLNRTTAWRILVTLEHNELVDRDPSSQRYRLGFGLMDLAQGADPGPLVRLARPVLEAVAAEVGEQASLGVPRRFGFTYVDQAQPPGGASVPPWLGQSGPLHATASGKVFLAALPQAERDAVLPAELERFTSTTITDRAALERVLARTTEAGYAVTDGEHDGVTSAVCAGVADRRGRLVAIIDVWGPTQRLAPERLDALGPILRRAADELAARLAPEPG